MFTIKKIQFGKRDIAIFTIPERLNEEAFRRMLSGFEEIFGVGQVIILDNGLTLDSIITRE